MRIFVRTLILAAIGAAIVYCMHSLGTGNLTPREDGLLSIVLTGLSILASWLVSDMYSQSQHKAAIEQVEESHRTNLRTYALKAAEKVTNLSNELSRLATYLQQELDYTEYRSAEEELQAKEERLESAIHLISTLKSVNDTSLSDWQGVIGDELDEQREEIRERERALQALLMDHQRRLAFEDRLTQHTSTPPDETRAEIEALRRELKLAVTAIGGVSLPFHHASRIRKRVEVPCPKCGKDVKFKEGTSERSIKAIRCGECDIRLVARYREGSGSYLTLRVPVDEKYQCPSCGTAGTVGVDPVAGGVSSSTVCKECGQNLTFTRSLRGIQVSSVSRQPIDDDLLKVVRMKLPVQPWPKGIHREIADELGLSSALVSRAIDKLIASGEFTHQEDGVLRPGTEPRGE